MTKKPHWTWFPQIILPISIPYPNCYFLFYNLKMIIIPMILKLGFYKKIKYWEMNRSTMIMSYEALMPLNHLLKAGMSKLLVSFPM